MRRVALTGGIATGKSYVLRVLRDRGIPCLDADELAHGVMIPGGEVTAAIARRFGPDVLDATGAVDRRILGPRVFADPQARRELEALVHPAVYRAIAAGVRAIALSEPGTRMAVVAVPLLYEPGHAGDFDVVIATVCAPDLQRRRLRDRGVEPEDIERRLLAQMPADEKAALADHVIRTDGSFADSDAQIDAILRLLRP